MASDYIPHSDGDMLKWDSNFSGKLPKYASDLGLSPEEVVNMQNNCKNIDSSITDCTMAQALAKEAATHKLIVLNLSIPTRCAPVLTGLKRQAATRKPLARRWA